MLESTLAFDQTHNHQRCVSTALTKARELSKERGQRLTPIRELVLKLVWQSHKPLGAYEILPSLADAGFNSAPPTVYRALEYLQELGLIHRISSLNAFVGCPDPQHKHPSGFMICKHCKTTAELDISALSKTLSSEAQSCGFLIEEESLEIAGICKRCQERADEQP